MKNKKELEHIENPKGVFRTTLEYTDDAMLCHFNMKKGAKISIHNHAPSQMGYVVKGCVKFLLENGKFFIAETGCSYSFDSHEYHGAEVMEDSEIIECFSPSRDEYK